MDNTVNIFYFMKRVKPIGEHILDSIPEEQAHALYGGEPYQLEIVALCETDFMAEAMLVAPEDSDMIGYRPMSLN